MARLAVMLCAAFAVVAEELAAPAVAPLAEIVPADDESCGALNFLQLAQKAVMTKADLLDVLLAASREASEALAEQDDAADGAEECTGNQELEAPMCFEGTQDFEPLGITITTSLTVRSCDHGQGTLSVAVKADGFEAPPAYPTSGKKDNIRFGLYNQLFNFPDMPSGVALKAWYCPDQEKVIIGSKFPGMPPTELQKKTCAEATSE